MEREQFDLVQQLSLVCILGNSVIQGLHAVSTTEGTTFLQENVLHQIRGTYVRAVLRRSTRQGTTRIR